MSDYPQFPPPPGGQYNRPPGPSYPQPQQPQYPHHTPHAAPPPPKKSRWLKPLLIIGGVLVVLIVAIGVVGAMGGGSDNGSDEKGDGQLGGGPTSNVEVDPDKVDRGEILRDSQNFQQLSAPQFITPGAKYGVDSKDGLAFCSLGWMVREPSNPQQFYNLTAGHCGEPGDAVYLDPVGKEDPSDFIQIGKFIAQDFAGEQNIEAGADYALIQIDPRFNDYIRATPDLSARGKKLDLVGTASVDQLKEYKPYTCHLGWRSGLSCGSFRSVENGTNLLFDGITDHGDSGGVVWSFDPTDPMTTRIYASGVVSWVDFDTSADQTNAKTIFDLVQELGVEVVKD